MFCVAATSLQLSKRKIWPCCLVQIQISFIALSKLFTIFPTANSSSHSLSSSLFIVSVSSLPSGKKVWLCLCTPKTPSPAPGVLAEENAIKLYYRPSYAGPDSMIASYTQIQALIWAWNKINPLQYLPDQPAASPGSPIVGFIPLGTPRGPNEEGHYGCAVVWEQSVPWPSLASPLLQ